MGAAIPDTNPSLFIHIKLMHAMTRQFHSWAHISELFPEVHKKRCMRKSIAALFVVPGRGSRLGIRPQGVNGRHGVPCST